jgi:transcriptional regulator with XRE-family HTH domain
MVTTAQKLPLFAIRMKAARKRSGISQMELGALSGIDESSASARINQYERGKHTPDFSTACNLAKVLDVPTAYFYAEDDALAELILMFGKFKSTEQKSLVSLIESQILQSNLASPKTSKRPSK